MKELGEPPLRKHDGLGEAVEVQAQQAPDSLAHLAGPSCQDCLTALEARLLGGRAARRASHDAHGRVELVAHLELKRHSGLGRELADHRSNSPSVVVSDDAAKQGEDDAVDDRGLSRSGRPDQRGELHIAEVDLGVLAEGGEPAHAKLQRPHGCTDSRSASC